MFGAYVLLPVVLCLAAALMAGTIALVFHGGWEVDKNKDFWDEFDPLDLSMSGARLLRWRHAPLEERVHAAKCAAVTAGGVVLAFFLLAFSGALTEFVFEDSWALVSLLMLAASVPIGGFFSHEPSPSALDD